jgi:hypothetical protein
MTEHSQYRVSVTLQTPDLAQVGCLRALSQFSQSTGNNRIPWGGTTDTNWKSAGQRVTFRFSSPAYRASFISQAQRLLPAGLWEKVAENDQDPASPQQRN